MSVQTLVQALGFLVGFLIVRALDKQGYALYTATTSAITALVTLCSGGIIAASTALGGRSWQDSHHIGQVLASANRIRKRLSMWIALPAAAFLFWLLAQNGASWLDLIVLIMLAAIAAQAQVTAEILRVALRLQGQLKQLIKLDFGMSALRFVLTLVLFLTARADVAILTIVVSAIILMLLTRRAARPTVELAAAPDPEIESRIWLVVRRQWPNDLAYIFQSQIILALLALLGEAATVADYGALGRIAAIFGPLGAALNTIVLPRFARCQEPRRLRTFYYAMMAAYAVVLALPVLATAAFPAPLLWILGAQYAGLDYQLFLVTLNASTASFAFLAWGANGVRGWVIVPWLNIPLMYGTQILLITGIGVDSMNRILWVGIASNIASALTSYVATLRFTNLFSRV